MNALEDLTPLLQWPAVFSAVFVLAGLSFILLSVPVMLAGALNRAEVAAGAIGCGIGTALVVATIFAVR